MRVIAIEEHFITPMYREKVVANEFRNFYLSSRSEQLRSEERRVGKECRL